MSEAFKGTGFSIGAPPIDMHKEKSSINKNGTIELSDYQTAGSASRMLDFNVWLPYAAKEYHLSSDPRDFVLVPVPSIVTSVPNTNGDSASLKELTRFLPDYGQCAYKTWVGKPTFEEHDNQDVTKAKGIILDVYIRPMPRFPRFAKVVKLLSFDRTKDPELCSDILNRKIDTYSMGWMYSSYRCSICNAHVGRGIGGTCAHTAPMQPTYRNVEGKLAYRQCEKLYGFETSAVRNPAYVLAQSPFVYDLSSY